MRENKGEWYTRCVTFELIFNEIARYTIPGLSDNGNIPRIPFDPNHTHCRFIPLCLVPLRPCVSPPLTIHIVLSPPLNSISFVTQ